MKKVTIKESDLVSLISKIVNESVGSKKKQWMAEQKKKNEAIIENKISELKS